MHHSVLLVASVLLLLILSGHSQFLDQDPDPDFDPSLELFSPSNDFFIDDPQPEISSNLDDPQTELSSNLDDPQPEVSSNLDDLPYPYFLADASECNSASNGSPNKIRARQNNACPVPNDEQETIPRMPSADRDRVINQLLGPLDNSVDQTGETAKKNFVNTLCLASSINRQTIPVCTSGLEDDVYPNALGGVNLRNCELCESLMCS